MAQATYAFLLKVKQDTLNSGITTAETTTLFEKPKISTSKAKKDPVVTKLATEEETGPKLMSLTDLSQGYDEIIGRAEELLAKLRARVGVLTYTFDPNKEPILAQSIADTFQGERNRITYPMYMAALRLDKELAQAIGEEGHGLNQRT